MRLLLGPILFLTVGTVGLGIDYSAESTGRTPPTMSEYKAHLPERIGYLETDTGMDKTIRTVAFVTSRVAGAGAVMIGQRQAQKEATPGVSINRNNKVDFPEEQLRQRAANAEEDAYRHFKQEGRSDRVALFAASFTGHFTDYMIGSDFVRNNGRYKDCKKSSNIINRC